MSRRHSWLRCAYTVGGGYVPRRSGFLPGVYRGLPAPAFERAAVGLQAARERLDGGQQPLLEADNEQAGCGAGRLRRRPEPSSSSSSVEKLFEWPLCGVAERNSRCSKWPLKSRTALVNFDSMP
ncbi:MAG: hypothetical protein J4F98_10645 [Acidobacteria bacterium]|nr:hypothetical protein [Acidobacteriota bacterium]